MLELIGTALVIIAILLFVIPLLFLGVLAFIYWDKHFINKANRISTMILPCLYENKQQEDEVFDMWLATERIKRCSECGEIKQPELFEGAKPLGEFEQKVLNETYKKSLKKTPTRKRN